MNFAKTMAGLTLPAAALVLAAGSLVAQQTPQAATVTADTYKGSVTAGASTGSMLELSLDDAIQRGLKNNLGLILSSTQAQSARGQRLEQLQALLPNADFKADFELNQTNIQAEGLVFQGFPAVLGPYGYSDLRASMQWSVLNLSSLHSYLAAKHNFNAATLNAEDAREMVILTVGNAYLLVVADAAHVEMVTAQVATSKVSLDQAAANHKAGTAPELDELRARVDYQSQQQQLIAAQNTLEKDKLALARAIGLPLDQPFHASDDEPYAALDNVDVQHSIEQALNDRKDLAAIGEQVKSAESSRKQATADRLPTIKIGADYGFIGVNPANSYWTGNAHGTATVPLFDELNFRGEANIAQAQLDTNKAQLSDARAQVNADVRDALLDIAAAAKQVEVSRSNVDLAKEALSEAQQRYKAGVSDNLAVSEAQQSMAQADNQFVTSLYQHNVAKLNLARALGAASHYKDYVGGK